MTNGYGTPEEAIQAWLEANDFVYSGDCTTGTRESGTYCSTFDSNVARGKIFMSAPIDAEPAYWMFVMQIDTQWYVADVSTFSGSTAPPSAWH